MLTHLSIADQLKAAPFMAQKWEEHWEKPLAQWQTELGLTPTRTHLVIAA